MEFFYTEKLAHIPEHFLTLADYERAAPYFMPKPVYEYIACGASDEDSLANNVGVFDHWQIMPQALNNFTDASTALAIAGQPLCHPIILAPVAYQRLLHEDGELATAMACEATESQLIVSTLASQPWSHICNHTTNPWFQLYFQPTKQETLRIVRHIEDIGYQALFVTVDVPINGLRLRAQRVGFTLPKSVSAVNLIHQDYEQTHSRTLAPGQSVILNGYMAAAPTWKDLEWLLQITTLPVFIKGLLNPLDVTRAQQMGCRGVVVSNHGGRSLDGLPSPMQLLKHIRTQVGPEFILLMDGAVRRGSDLFKAIALGANAVLVGRPQLYGLAIAGALGVAHSIKLLREEFELTMALAGCPTLADIGSHCLLAANSTEILC